MSNFEMDLPEPLHKKPSLADLMAALRREADSPQQVISSTIIYGLSDLTLDERDGFESLWRDLPATFKHRVLRALNESIETMFELSFSEITRLSLEDASGLVRAPAVELLWAEGSPWAMRRLLILAAADPDLSVRVNAMRALANFILRGEYGEVSPALAQEAQELALRLHTDATEPLKLRCCALEALANSSHPQVEPLIRAAYADGNHDMRTSAIFAMGRTCNAIWRDILLEELNSDDNEAVYEAIAACGQIQLSDSVQRIGELTLSQDRELQLGAIWALGEIGGKQAFQIFSELAEVLDDDESAELIDEALQSANLNMGLPAFDLQFDLG